MGDVTIGLLDHAVRTRLARAMDTEARIPAALDALGPVAERDVAVIDATDGELTSRLLALGGWVRSVSGMSSAAIGAVPDARADVLVAGWSAFRPGSADWDAQLAQARRVLRPDGRLLVVHDYGRDDVTPLLDDAEHAARFTAWSRPNGPFLQIGFRIRVLHCWWRWDTLEEATEVLGIAFGDRGSALAATMRRPRLAWKVAVYHLAMDATPVTVATPRRADRQRPTVGGGGALSSNGVLTCT